MKPIEKKLEQALRWEIDAHAERSDRWEAISANAYQPKPSRRFPIQKLSAVAVAAAMVLVTIGVVRAGMGGKLPSGEPVGSFVPGGTVVTEDAASLAYATPPPLQEDLMTPEFAEVLGLFTSDSRELLPASTGKFVTLTLMVYRNDADSSISANSLNWQKSTTLEGAYAFPELPSMPPLTLAETYGLAMTGELAEFYAQELNAGNLGETPLLTFLERLRNEEYRQLRESGDGVHYQLSIFDRLGTLYPFYDSEVVNDSLPDADAALERLKLQIFSLALRSDNVESLLRQSLQASAGQDDLAYTVVSYGVNGTTFASSAVKNGEDTAYGTIGGSSSGVGFGIGTIQQGVEPTDDVLLQMGQLHTQHTDGPRYGFAVSNRLLREFFAQKDMNSISFLSDFFEKVGKGEVPLEEGDLIAFLDDASWTKATPPGLQVGNVYHYVTYEGAALRPDIDSPEKVFSLANGVYSSIHFTESIADERTSSTTEDGTPSYLVATTDTFEKMYRHIGRYFSEKITDEVFANNSLFHTGKDGKLYVVLSDPGVNEFIDGVSYSLVSLTDTRCEYEMRVSYKEGWWNENPGIYTAVLEKEGDNWVFTEFPYPYFAPVTC